MPDIICLTEHHLKVEAITQLKIHPEFNVVSHSCRNRFKGGGTVVLIKKQILSNPNYTFTELIKDKDLEFAACKLELPVGKLNILCIYRSPSGNIDIFFTSLRKILDKLDPEDKTLGVGDFNIDLDKKKW